MRDTFHVNDPATLRAIAHPVRQRILTELSVLGHARAADLAREIGEPANSVSFHLRVLARAGMIVEAPEHARDRRDRVWTNVARTYAVRPGAPGALRDVVRPALAWAEESFAEAAAGAPARADRVLALSSLAVTPEQAAEMAAELEELLGRWAERSLTDARTEPRAGRRTYQVLTVLGPRTPDDGRDEDGQDDEAHRPAG